MALLLNSDYQESTIPEQFQLFDSHPNQIVINKSVLHSSKTKNIFKFQ